MDLVTVFVKRICRTLRLKYFKKCKKNKKSQNKVDMSSMIMENTDLEKEYTPTMWSGRYPTPDDVLKSHIQFCIKESELTTNSVPHKLEIEYGPTPRQKFDILGTDLPDSSPILVYVHGGFWQNMSREISRYPAKPLYHSKIKTIVLGYDLCPAVTLAEIILQIQRATRFIFEYAEKIGSKGVYFAGHCAGAHLVAKLFSSAEFLDSAPGSHILQGAFLISGVYDLRDLIHTTCNKRIQLPHEWTVPLSPQFDRFTHLQTRNVRIYVLAAQHDSPTFKKQSRDIYELLHNTCLMQNIYLEIKDDMDHFQIVECFINDYNYLKNLLLHDIRKHL